MKKTGSPFYKSILIAVCLALMIYTVALAASGDLDPTFSGDGRIIQSFGGTRHYGWDVAVQTDGKVVAVGEKWIANSADFAIARYNPNGTLDTTFSGDGKQVVNIRARDQNMGVAIQTDGKIILGGYACNVVIAYCDLAIMRLTANGTLDTTFSGDGKVITSYGTKNGGLDIAIHGTKIVVAGFSHDGASYNATVYQYLPNGTLDSTFSGDGILTIDFGGEDIFNGVVVYNGKIYVTGQSQPSDYNSSDIIAARINSNGTLDTTFSGDGKVVADLGTYDVGMGLAISGGKVVVVGSSDANIAIMRYTASGALDPTFSGDGKVKVNLGLSSPSLEKVIIQAGKIVAVGGTGSYGDGLLVRYTAAGNLDPTFSGDGIVTTDWGGGSDHFTSVVLKNTHLYVVGNSTSTSGILRFIIAAYLP